MNKQQVEDLAIEFDEYGFEPTILCDIEMVIERYRNALKEIIKDYETMDMLKVLLRASVKRYELTFEPNVLWYLSKDMIEKIRKFIDE